MLNWNQLPPFGVNEQALSGSHSVLTTNDCQAQCIWCVPSCRTLTLHKSLLLLTLFYPPKSTISVLSCSTLLAFVHNSARSAHSSQFCLRNARFSRVNCFKFSVYEEATCNRNPWDNRRLSMVVETQLVSLLLRLCSEQTGLRCLSSRLLGDQVRADPRDRVLLPRSYLHFAWQCPPCPWHPSHAPQPASSAYSDLLASIATAVLCSASFFVSRSASGCSTDSDLDCTAC